MPEEELDPKKTEEKAIQLTRAFMDKHLLDSHSLTYRVAFKEELVELCKAYIDQGFDLCVHELRKANNTEGDQNENDKGTSEERDHKLTDGN